MKPLAHCRGGLPDFHGLLSEDGAANACLVAFDLLMVDGEDVRRQPTEARIGPSCSAVRKGTGCRSLRRDLERDGPDIYRHACALGLEGIVSKRRDAGYGRGSPGRGSRSGIRITSGGTFNAGSETETAWEGKFPD